LLSHLVAIGRHRITTSQLQLLRDSGVPILVCVGTRDVLVRPSNSCNIRSQLNAQLHVFRGEGHGLIAEVNDDFNPVLIDHLRFAHRGSKYLVPGTFFHVAQYYRDNPEFFAKKSCWRRYRFVVGMCFWSYVAWCAVLYGYMARNGRRSSWSYASGYPSSLLERFWSLLRAVPRLLFWPAVVAARLTL